MPTPNLAEIGERIFLGLELGPQKVFVNRYKLIWGCSGWAGPGHSRVEQIDSFLVNFDANGDLNHFARETMLLKDIWSGSCVIRC